MSNPRWLLKADAIQAMEGQLKVHHLNSNAVRLNKSLGDAVGLKNIGFHLITVLPGRDSTEYHKHHYEEECIYVLSGTGAANIDGTTYSVAAGDFLGFPTGEVAHALTNNGAEPLVCLVAGQRLLQDVCDYPNVGKRLYINSGERNLVDFSNITYQSKTSYGPK